MGLATGAAVSATAVALHGLLGGLGEGFGPMTFLPAILLAGLIGGSLVGSGLGVLCVLVAWIWFFRPYGTFILTPRDAVTMTIFSLTAGLELYAIGMLKLTVSDLSLARERSNTLFRELQHRVANNLQFVAAFLQLRKKTLEQGSAGAHALEVARSRLALMSRVHRRLHDPGAVDLPVGAYLKDLCADLISASDMPGIRLAVEAPPIKLDLETLMSVSLIVAELVTNSLKYAFRGRTEGSIAVKLGISNRVHTLTVSDDGCGLPAAFGQTKGAGLGQTILESLASQIGGRIFFETRQGTVARLVFQRAARPLRQIEHK